jgi:outer membrane protein TolC
MQDNPHTSEVAGSLFSAGVVLALGLLAATSAMGQNWDTLSEQSAPTPQTNDSSEQGGVGGALMIPTERLDAHIPDPVEGAERALAELEAARDAGDAVSQAYQQRLLERTNTIRRAEQFRLSLEDALHRALRNSFVIDVQRYNPAVNTTRVIEAQAAFDAVFFANITKNKVDRPSASSLTSTSVDLFDSRYGLSKVLPSGMQVSASYGLRRTRTALSFQQLNPEYFNDLTIEVRQPLLRGFGVDQNRSLIVIANNDRSVSAAAFRRQIRDTLRQVEELYWRLVQARRDVVISARLLADFESIYDYLIARKDFDVMPVQLAATKANLEQSRTNFVQFRANVFDAEDRLIAAMNDPAIDLADDLEIVPTDFPTFGRIVVDRLAEAQLALENRQEIREQRLTVANAKIAVGRAINAELPKLDLTLRYTSDGLAKKADAAFDQLSQSNFLEYFVGVDLEVPIGNRAPRAARRRAELQHLQAVAQLKAVYEDVLLDVNLAVRKLDTTYDQIGPSFESAEARQREVGSIVARAERKDFNTLNSELGARQSLFGARRTMLNATVDYNVAIIDLERAKGTLLQYYNIVIPD